MKRALPTQIVRFTVVGLISTAVNYGIFYLLFAVYGSNYLISSGLGFIVGVFVGFLFNKSWTFSSNGSSRNYAIAYALVYCFSLGLSIVFLHITVEKLHLDARLANLLSIVLTTIVNFLGTKILVFKA